MMLQKPIKIHINNPKKEVPLDYELAGKILDNVLVMAENQGFDITDLKFDKSITFSIGRGFEYNARLWQTKTAYMFEIGYMREIPKAEQVTKNKVLPKDKKRIDEMKAEEKKRKKAEADAKKKK